MAKVPRKPSHGTLAPDFTSGIRKTGFVLENRIAEELKASKWSVISNKYYIDDLEEAVREIDLVAYRVGNVGHLKVYTTLIISCKKSESNTWAFLGREPDFASPNSDWWPLHAWSNDKALDFMLGQTGNARTYHDQITTLGVTEVLQDPEVDVFAFQEMDSGTGAPHNDKAMFGAVTSLMKAQAHEMGALPARKKNPTFYQFNLVSVVDADLIRLTFLKGEIATVSIEAEQYIARYIIRRKETFARVRFVTPEKFKLDLADYERLHKANCNWVKATSEAFYRDAIQDAGKREVFVETFRAEVGWYLSHIASKHMRTELDPKNISLAWSEARNIICIEVDVDRDTLAFLNGDSTARNRVASVLAKLYRYDGEFEFSEYIPF